MTTTGTSCMKIVVGDRVVGGGHHEVPGLIFTGSKGVLRLLRGFDETRMRGAAENPVVMLNPSRISIPHE